MANKFVPNKGGDYVLQASNSRLSIRRLDS